MNRYEKYWKEAYEQVAQFEDVLGCKMDPDIISAVTSLNVLGYQTDGSCQGHDEDGEVSLPYIDVDHRDQELFNGIGSMLLKVPRILARPLGYWVGWLLTSKIDDAREQNRSALITIEGLLGQYYQEHPSPSYFTLLTAIARGEFMSTRISFIGSMNLECYEYSAQQKILEECQAVMQHFSEWLYKKAIAQ